MKRKKKLVAIVMGVLIGTMSCMTAMAAIMSSSVCITCGYESEMYTVMEHRTYETIYTRSCEHDLDGYDVFCEHIEVREYYCPEEGCEPWRDEVVVGWYWRCEGQ